MRIKNVVRAAGVAAVAGVAGLSLAPAASAAPAALHPDVRYSTTYRSVQGQLDTNPGDGAPSWVWVYGGSGGGRVDYQFYDGSINSMYVNSGQASSTEPSAAVWRIRACTNSGACGSWT